MSRTFKDKPDRLAIIELRDDETLFEWMRKHKLDEAQLVYVKRYLHKTPKHGRLMRTFAGAYCSNKSCCKKTPSGAERQQEKRKWKALALLSE